MLARSGKSMESNRPVPPRFQATVTTALLSENDGAGRVDREWTITVLKVKELN